MLRRKFIRESVIGVTSSLLMPSAPAIISKRYSSKNKEVIGHNSHQYKVHQDWAKASIANTPILNCHEMVLDSAGRLIMIGDHTENNILVFDKSGKLLDHWGTRYPGGHGLSIFDEGGEDVLFICDAGWHLNRYGKWENQAGVVSKTTVDGRLIFNLPDPRLVGIYAADEPFLPTETSIAPNGDIYVADGYGSDYILQYNLKGEFIRKFGGHNNPNEDHNLRNSHGVAVDTRDSNNPVLICTSRQDNCMKYFTLDGNYIKTIQLPGMFICRPVIDDDQIYAGVCWSVGRDEKRSADSGFVTIVEDDKVISNPGGTAPHYIDGVLQRTYQADDPIFNHGHDVCVDEDKNVYVCQWRANQTFPIKLERV